MGGPTGRQVHPAFTDEQQFGRKRYRAHGQLGNDSATTVGRLP